MVEPSPSPSPSPSRVTRAAAARALHRDALAALADAGRRVPVDVRSALLGASEEVPVACLFSRPGRPMLAAEGTDLLPASYRVVFERWFGRGEDMGTRMVEVAYDACSNHWQVTLDIFLPMPDPLAPTRVTEARAARTWTRGTRGGHPHFRYRLATYVKRYNELSLCPAFLSSTPTKNRKETHMTIDFEVRPFQDGGPDTGIFVLYAKEDGRITHAVCNVTFERPDEPDLFEVRMTPFEVDGDTMPSSAADFMAAPFELDYPEEAFHQPWPTVQELALEAFTRVSIGDEAHWPSTRTDFDRDVRLFSWQNMAVHAYNEFMGDDAYIDDFDDDDLEAWLRQPGGLFYGMGDTPETEASFSTMVDGGAS